MARRRALALLLLAMTVAAPPAAARGEELPARNQALLLLRVLAYDRNLADRAGPALTVVLLSRPGDRASERRSAALRGAFEEVAGDVVVAGLPVQVRELAFRGAVELEAQLPALHPALLAVDSALAAALPELLPVTRRHAITSAGTRAMAQAGAAVGLSASGGRAEVTINLPAARAEGADLDAALLEIAEVIREAAPASPEPRGP